MASVVQTYLVGGAVRDRLLGVDAPDRDWVVVGSTPEQMVDQGFEPVGKDFPVFINKSTGEEYALARTERKTAKGYQGFQFNASPEITLEQDLERRDLTINAMAQDTDGEIIDLHGGQQDLADGIIRHVSDAFLEDPVHIFFKVLRDCGALARVLPEIDDLFGVPQTAKYHPEIDTGIHTLMVIEQAALLSDDSIMRFAALTHDLGKAKTPEDILPSHRGHELGGLPIIRDLCERLRVPKKYQSLALAVSEYHLHMHKMFELRPQTVLKMLEKTRCLMDDDRAKQFAQCCIADARGRTGFEDRDYAQADLFLTFQQAVKNVNAGEIAKACAANGDASGEQIQAAIHDARLREIKLVKASLRA